jgi:protein subunit release factor B
MGKELLFSVTSKDFRIDYFAAPGPGGQNKNKTKSACRMVHEESGAVGQCVEHREQARNRQEAFRRCVESDTFKKWHRIKSAAMMLRKSGQKSIEEQVEDALLPKNLKIEVKENNKWVREN